MIDLTYQTYQMSVNISNSCIKINLSKFFLLVGRFLIILFFPRIILLIILFEMLFCIIILI